MRMRAIALGVLLVSSVAAAQEAPATSPTSTPGFLLSDRQDGESRAGFEGEYFLLGGSGDGDLWRAEVHGQFVDPVSHAGGYLHLPLAFTTGTNDDTGALGNLEVGGIFTADLHDSNFGITMHAGVTLPTAPDQNAPNEKALLGYLTGLMHPADLYQVIPKSSTVRVGISPLIRNGQFFARLDLGVDINVYLADANDTADPAMHLNVGVGIDLGTMNAALMAEVSTLHIFSDANISPDNDHNISVAAISVRGYSGTVQPYVGFVIPIDKTVGDLFDGGIMIGFDGRL